MPGKTPKEIKAKLGEVSAISAPAFEDVYNRANEFKRGQTSTIDELVVANPVYPQKIDRSLSEATKEIARTYDPQAHSISRNKRNRVLN